MDRSLIMLTYNHRDGITEIKPIKAELTSERKCKYVIRLNDNNTYIYEHNFNIRQKIGKLKDSRYREYFIISENEETAVKSYSEEIKKLVKVHLSSVDYLLKLLK